MARNAAEALLARFNAWEHSHRVWTFPASGPGALRETHAGRRGRPEGILRRAEEDPTARWIGNFDHVEQDVHDRYRFQNETEEDVETIPAAPDAIMDEDHLFVHALVDLPNSGVEVVKPVSERENLGRRSERTGMERLPLLRRLAYHAHRRSTEEGGVERLQPVLEALHARVSNDDALAREICLTSDEGGHWTMLLMPQEGHRWGFSVPQIRTSR